MEEEEAGAIKWGDKMVRGDEDIKYIKTSTQVNRLCQQERELEIELEVERRRLADASKSHRKALRGEKLERERVFLFVLTSCPGIQEYKLRTEEAQKAGERLANLVDKLQHQVVSIVCFHANQVHFFGQVGSYKKQIEEAEEISTINLCESNYPRKSSNFLFFPQTGQNKYTTQANTVVWRVSCLVRRIGLG